MRLRVHSPTACPRFDALPGALLRVVSPAKCLEVLEPVVVSAVDVIDLIRGGSALRSAGSVAVLAPIAITPKDANTAKRPVGR